MTSSAHPASATDRVIGPWVDMRSSAGGRSAVDVGLKAGIRPWVGRMVASPVQ